MGQLVIACYRPKPGKEEMLRQLLVEHIPILRKEDLVTSRELFPGFEPLDL